MSTMVKSSIVLYRWAQIIMHTILSTFQDQYKMQYFILYSTCIIQNKFYEKNALSFVSMYYLCKIQNIVIVRVACREILSSDLCDELIIVPWS